MSALTEDRPSECFPHSDQFSHEKNSCMTTPLYNTIKPASINSFPDLETPLYRALNLTACKPSTFPRSYTDFTNGFVFSSTDTPESRVMNIEDASKNSESIGFGGEQQPFDNFPMNNLYHANEQRSVRTTTGFPFIFPEKVVVDEWKINMAWDSPPGPSESITYSTK